MLQKEFYTLRLNICRFNIERKRISQSRRLLTIMTLCPGNKLTVYVLTVGEKRLEELQLRRLSVHDVVQYIKQDVKPITIAIIYRLLRSISLSISTLFKNELELVQAAFVISGSKRSCSFVSGSHFCTPHTVYYFCCRGMY